MEIWVPVIVALVALVGTVGQSGATHAASRHHLEALEKIQKLTRESDDAEATRILEIAERNLASRLELRYRMATRGQAALIGLGLGLLIIGVVLAALPVLAQVWWPSLDVHWLVWVSTPILLLSLVPFFLASSAQDRWLKEKVKASPTTIRS